MMTPIPLMIALALSAAPPEPIKVGALMSVTGPASFLGAPEARTLEMLVDELNQHGGTVVDRMKDDYWNLYREVKNERIADEEQERIGYWQDKFSKMEMVDALAEWTHNGQVLFRDAATITEMSRYGYDDKGRLTAPKGMNDDLVAGLGLCVVGARSLVVERSARPVRTFKPWEM